MSVDPLALAAGILLAAAARARQLATGEAPADYGEALQLAQQGSILTGAQLGFSTVTLGTTPLKLFEAHSSPGRTVVIHNRSTTGQLVRVSVTSDDLLAGGGIELPVSAVLINEPPAPHTGEWWAVASAAGALLVIAEQP